VWLSTFEAQNKNIKNYKDLSQEEHELFEKIDLIDSPAKRKKERDALVGLLEQKPADLILRAYRFVIANGTLGRQDTCHHPFCYLLSTIDDILQKIKVPVKTEIALSIADFDEEKNFENALSLLKVFQTSVDLDTREKMIDNYLIEIGSGAFIPSRKIASILVASKWKQNQLAQPTRGIAA
jgi:hypothetical protein